MIRNKVLIVLISLFIGMAINAPSMVDPSLSVIRSDQLSSGEINGIKYSYGERTFSTSGNITHTSSGQVVESFSASATGVANIPLITGSIIDDVFYFLTRTTSNSTHNFTRDVWHDQLGYDALLDYITMDVPLKFDSLNATHGLELMKINVTERVDVYRASVIDINGNFIGQYPMNVSFIEYLDKNLVTGEVFYQSIVVVPAVIVIQLFTEVHQVFYNRTQVAFSWMNYFSRYSVRYNITATGYQVNITNGENFGLHVTMFDRIDAEYLEAAYSFINYAYFAADFTELQFSEDGTTGNGTDVSSKGFGYPLDLLPAFASGNGTIFEAGIRHISSSMISTYQGVVAAFLQKTNETASSILDQTSINARLAVWGVSSSTTMVAFNDGNGNGRLDVGANNDDGIFVDPADQVEAIGLAEAFETNVTNAYYRSHAYNESVNFAALGVSHEVTNANQTVFDYNTASYGFGEVDSSSSSNFSWTDPTEDIEGNVEFNFGVDYTNFPVTWVNMTDGSTTIDKEDIGYHYKVVVNPETGHARISPTWTHSGITDPNLKQKAQGLSLALLVKSEFFSLKASYTADKSNSTLNASRTRTFSALDVRIGAQQVTNIDVTGPKESYVSNGVTHTAKFDAIRLLTVSGHFRGERVSPFSSESEETGGNAVKGSLVEQLSVDVFYAVDLIVISYPVWDGNDIVHDPDYSLNYQQTEQPEDTSSSEEPPSENEASTRETASDQSSDTTSDETPQGPRLPGFTWLISLSSITILVVLLRRRK